MNKVNADMAELADAIDLGSIPKGWGFESLYPHHKTACGLYHTKRCINTKLFLCTALVFTAAAFGFSLGCLNMDAIDR